MCSLTCSPTPLPSMARPSGESSATSPLLISGLALATSFNQQRRSSCIETSCTVQPAVTYNGSFFCAIAFNRFGGLRDFCCVSADIKEYSDDNDVCFAVTLCTSKSAQN